MMLVLVAAFSYLLLRRLDKVSAHQGQALADRTRIAEVRDALIGYALRTGCLPCPAVSALNGQAAATCSAATRTGFVPWETLGAGAFDAGNNRLRYSVDPAFATGCVLTQSSTGDVRIRTRDAAGNALVLATGQPAAVVGHGRNGYGATSASGIAQPAVPPAHVDEAANRANGTDFMQRPVQEDETPAAAGGAFDDVVAWVPLSVLIARLNHAYGLPP